MVEGAYLAAMGRATSYGLATSAGRDLVVILETVSQEQEPYSGTSTHNLGLRDVEWPCLGASESNFAGDRERFFQAYPATPQSYRGGIPEVRVPSGGPIPNCLFSVRLFRIANQRMSRVEMVRY